jgi:hypothetical protein
VAAMSGEDMSVLGDRPIEGFDKDLDIGEGDSGKILMITGPATRSPIFLLSPMRGVTTGGRGLAAGVRVSFSSLIGLTPGKSASFLRLLLGAVELPESDVSDIPGEGERDWGIWKMGGLSASVTGDDVVCKCGSDGLVKRSVVPTTATSRDDLRTWPGFRPGPPTASDNERV